ncbi:LacI family DNA-binding transcriptional regulator [uncultured Fibrobacter sp.]|uniref:LacI family DNA-binding transcriptional regulator n=1 Tax=uncultured Fibrobacter sp. TaxID=261512 RepID=UPI00262A9A17|nr:LacI family DNA-binding transcriptional regulator [uncultured Fibrobacter sp.]
MSATIYDIAKRCNCSIATVSKVFNNTGTISKKKREEILRVSHELGYIPSESARGLAKADKTTKMIGVLLHINDDKSIGHYLFSSILNSFRIVVEQYGYDVAFLSKIEEDSPYTYLDKVKSRGFDGVFVISANKTETKVKHLFESDYPLVAFDNPGSGCTLTSNNKEIVSELVDYLVSKGHRKICYILPQNKGIAKIRFEGFIEGLKRNGIEFDERMVIPGSYFTIDSVEKETDLALKSGIEPTVIMYPDDYSAVNAIPYLRKLGMKVPSNISVTGFDGIDIASVMHPSIVTVKQDAKSIGYEAAMALIKLINKEPVQKRKIVVPALICEGTSVKNIG